MSSTANLGLTQISGNPTVTKIGAVLHAAALDAAVPYIVIGCDNGAAREPPTAYIYQLDPPGSPTIDVERSAASVFRPDTDALAFYESLEAMRVLIKRPVVVGPTNRFGETPVVASKVVNGETVLCASDAQVTPRGGVIIDEAAGLFNPERMLLDDLLVKYGGPFKVKALGNKSLIQLSCMHASASMPNTHIRTVRIHWETVCSAHVICVAHAIKVTTRMLPAVGVF